MDDTSASVPTGTASVKAIDPYAFPRVEIKVREVKRWIVTKFERASVNETGRSSQIGEYDNEDTADAVALAIAREEHRKLGYPPGDDRIQYPDDKHSRRCAQSENAYNPGKPIGARVQRPHPETD